MVINHKLYKIDLICIVPGLKYKFDKGNFVRKQKSKKQILENEKKKSFRD